MSDHEKIITVTSDNFKEQVLDSKLPVLVDFWAPWCGPCRMLAPVIDAVADELSDKIAVGKINVDDEGPLAARYEIMTIPTLYLFKNGEAADKLIGLKSKETLLDWINARL